jgi:MYXO-CTERM domain-containing protein
MALPAPTERGPGEDGEADAAARRAWIAERHRAPPGVDWRRVERENGRAQRDKRNRLASMYAEPTASPWVERGSDNQAGRIHVARRSQDGARLYVGSALGGVWKGTLDGDAWEPIGDSLYGGAQHLAVLSPTYAGGPDVVLAATSAGGVNRTEDDGATWETPAGLEGLDDIRRLVVTSDGTETVLLVGGYGGNYGLYRSTDGGNQFAEVVDLVTYAGDVWAARDGGKVFLYKDDRVSVSDDDGDTFVDIGSPGTGSTAAELVGSEAGAPRLWVATWVGGEAELHRSDDAGRTWTWVTTLTDYTRTLGASTVDRDLFTWGGVELHRTTDGGETFTPQNEWAEYYGTPASALHADLWSADAVPDGTGTETWYFGTDGGLYRSTDELDTVENLSLVGLRVGQYYSTLTSSADATHVAAGSQDQGYQMAFSPGSGGVLRFDQEVSGDYGHLSSGDGSLDYVFSVYPGQVLVQHQEDDDPELTFVTFPEGEVYGWMPPIVADPEAHKDAFFGAAHLYRYGYTHTGWDIDRYGDQDFRQFSNEYVSAIAFSPIDPQLAFVATSFGGLFRSADHGLTWTRSDEPGPRAQYFYGTALWPSRRDATTVYVGGSGYGTPAVYRSTDGGITWADWGEGLPDTLVYALGEAPDGSGRMYAGTETAAYARGPDDAAWVDITGADAPVTIYWSVEAVPGADVMRFGTYGRGIWDYAVPDLAGYCYPVVDADGDGVACDRDCDDADPARLPGATDACGDGVDADCDGVDPTCDSPPGDSAAAADTSADSGDAVAKDAADVDPPPATDAAPGGCGCATTGDGSGIALVAIAALLLPRRRRPRRAVRGGALPPHGSPGRAAPVALGPGTL